MALAVVVLTPATELFAHSDVVKMVNLSFSVERTALAPNVKFVVSEFPRERLNPESRNPPQTPYSFCADSERMVLIESLLKPTLPDDVATSILSAAVDTFPDTCLPSFAVTFSGSSDEMDLTASHFTLSSPAYSVLMTRVELSELLIVPLMRSPFASTT